MIILNVMRYFQGFIDYICFGPCNKVFVYSRDFVICCHLFNIVTNSAHRFSLQLFIMVQEYLRDYAVDEYSTDCAKEKWYIECPDCHWGHYTGIVCSSSYYLWIARNSHICSSVLFVLCRFINLFIYLSIYLSIYLYLWSFIYLSI